MTRSTVRLVLALLIAAGLGASAFAGIAGAKSRAPKKPVSRKSAAGKATVRKAAQKTAQKTKTRGTAASKKSSKSRAKSRRSRRVRGQQAPTPERITEIQQALAKGGSFAGDPTGKWDDSTVEAMKKFQEAHGLMPTGKLDAHTLQQLGLGSQIAGVAPPMPPVSSSSLASSTASQTTPTAAPQTHPQL